MKSGGVINRLPNDNGPLNAVELGRAAWPILHRMTLSYPEKPTEQDKSNMGKLLKGFSWLYPCKICATDFRKKMEEFPPNLNSRDEFAMWLCHQHNLVNEKLMKSEFKCSIRRLELIYGRDTLRKQYSKQF